MNRSWSVLAFLLVFSSASIGISDGIGVEPRALDSTHRREAVEQRAGRGHADNHTGNCPHCQEEDDYDFWIGDLGRSEPIFTGPHQYPFICSTSESGLGQPLVDNDEGIGNAVFAVEGDNTSEILGYSADCSIQTRVDYFYLATDGRFYPYDSSNPPADIYQFLIGGQVIDFIVRVEAGTLNRFLYAIAMLAPFPEELDDPDDLNNAAWNGDLVYYFRGGTGLGHLQGTDGWHSGVASGERAIFPHVLANGYAIAMSSANQSGIQYNVNLAEETAYMVKQHFSEVYGSPQHTIGIGGSGGAVQIYALAQNHPGLLDAGIPLFSYPDMITQTIHVSDCNLLEQYFLEDVLLYGAASKWATWSNRQWIEGLNASDTVTNSLTGTPGSSECIEGWHLAAPTVINPYFTAPELLQALEFYLYPQEVIDDIRWTHWNDLENIYGIDDDGFAPIPMDNVGVQYGLQALVEGNISANEFLEINSCVGSWTEQANFVPFIPSASNLFDHENMNRDHACRAGIPAPRREGDQWAMEAAYLSGHVFTGETLSIPIIDLRPYLEHKLDMHNSRQSFSVRQRLLNGIGNSENQVIWFTGIEDDIQRVLDALATLSIYLSSGEKPATFTDACWDENGTLVDAGAGVWDGVLTDGPLGVCAQQFPVYSTSRMVAGDSFAGDMFKCRLMSVDRAIRNGFYGDVVFDEAQRALLDAIFPSGVCDYSKPDEGRPRGKHPLRQYNPRVIGDAARIIDSE